MAVLFRISSIRFHCGAADRCHCRQRARSGRLFLENEAELSDDDYHGSGDEDEDAIDVALPEDIRFVDSAAFEASNKEKRRLAQFHL